MPNCTPGISGSVGLPPVAITMWRALKRLPFTSTVCASTKRAAPRTYATPLAAKIALVDAVQAQHVRIALALQLRPVGGTRFDIEAIVARVTNGQGNAGRVPHDFLRHATHIDAGSSQSVRFDDGGFRAVFGRPLRTGQAAAAAADADKIECLVGHSRFPSYGDCKGPMIRVRRPYRPWPKPPRTSARISG